MADPAAKKSRNNSLLFIAFLVVCIFALYSIAVAIYTVDDCGDENSAKHWVVAPPHWACD